MHLEQPDYIAEMADLEILIAQFSDLLLDGSDITVKEIVSAQSNKPSSERNDTDMTDVEPLTAQSCKMDIDAPVRSKPAKRLRYISKAYFDVAASDSVKWIPVACQPLFFPQVPESTSGMNRSLNQSGNQPQGPGCTDQKPEIQDEMDIDASEKTQTITWDTYKACCGGTRPLSGKADSKDIHHQTWYAYRSA